MDRSLYTDGRHDVVSGDKLLPPGRVITIRPHTRFIDFPEHTHDYVEMVYMCKGRQGTESTEQRLLFAKESS